MDCSICLQDIQLFSCVSILPCGHTFHSSCYSQYRGNTCPLCRLPSMNRKVNTVMNISKNLFEWTADDFACYTKFVDNNEEFIKDKKNEILNECVNIYYNKKLTEIKYNIVDNTTNRKNNFVVLCCRFGDFFQDYPVIFIVNGPKYASKKFHTVLDFLNRDFPMFKFFVKKNNNSMCYEIIAKKF